MKKSIVIVLYVFFFATFAHAELLAHWQLNGNTIDSSGNDRNGLSTSGSGVKWQNSNGIDGAIEISGVKDYAVFPAVNTGTSFTITAWVKPLAYPNTWARVVESHFWSGFYLGTDDATPRKWMFSVNGSFNLRQKNVVVGQWQHLAGTYDGSTARLYINGQLVGSAPQNRPSKPNDIVSIGKMPDEVWDWSLQSMIDDVRIYNEALAPSKIETIYQGCTSPVGDLNNDCIVDLQDLADIANSWLNCSLANCN